ILVPDGSPQSILLTTNFGLVVSHDGGGSWDWICEEVIGVYANLYQIGPAPLLRLYASTLHGLSESSDGACTWQNAGGTLADLVVNDAFPHPTDPTRVFALAQGANDGPDGLYLSTDGGATFGPPVF